MKYILLFNIFILNLIFICGISNIIYGAPKNQVLSQEQAAKGDMASSNIERIICYKEAMKIWPENYEVVFKLGKVYLSDAKDSEGLELMDKVINSGNKDLQLRAYKCIYKHYNPSTETSKDLVNSDKWLRKITELEPNFLNFYNLGIINGPQGLKKLNDSITFFKKAYELKNTQKIVLFYIAENYFMLKDYASALSYIKKYPNANINHQNAFKLFVTTYYYYSKQDSRISGNALFKCEEYLKTWPNDADVIAYYSDLKKYAKPSMYAEADEISKNDVIPVAKEETTLLKKNEMVPTLISSKTYHSIKETFHLDCQNSIKTKNLNFKPLYDAIISKGYKPANNKFEVEVFAVHSSTVNRSEPIFSGTITDLNQAINIDYKKELRYFLITIKFDQENSTDYTEAPFIVTIEQ